MDSRDLLHALRLWLPDGRSVAAAGDDLAPTLAAAYAEFEQAVPRSGLEGPGEILPLAAAAAGRGLLQEAVQVAKTQAADHAPSESQKATLASLAWPDLLLVAACAHKNDAANRQLLALIQSQVLPALARKWGRDRAEDLVDELPQKLHLFDERGLNRGRPRLLAYGGRSRLIAWLRAVAHQGAIDRWRRQTREQSGDDLGETPDRAAVADAPDQLARDEDLDLVRRVGPQAFEQLMRQLPAVSEQQYRFAYFRCVGGLDNIEIADRLGVAKSRVTELSQQVFRRLIAILGRLAPELEQLSDDPTKERRRKVEEALQEWFGKADAASLGLGPDHFEAPAPRGMEVDQ